MCSSIATRAHVGLRPRNISFLEANDSAVERYGYSRAEFHAMTIREIRPSDEVSGLMASVSMSAVLQGSGPWTHRTKDA